MFEDKKMAALKTIEKKDTKLSEISAILRDEITPTLETLRAERSSYLLFQKTKVREHPGQQREGWAVKHVHVIHIFTHSLPD